MVRWFQRPVPTGPCHSTQLCFPSTIDLGRANGSYNTVVARQVVNEGLMEKNDASSSPQHRIVFYESDCSMNGWNQYGRNESESLAVPQIHFDSVVLESLIGYQVSSALQLIQHEGQAQQITCHRSLQKCLASPFLHVGLVLMPNPRGDWSVCWVHHHA